MRIVSHHGFALLTLLEEKDLVSKASTKDIRLQETRRHLLSDTSALVYILVIGAADRDARKLFYNNIGVLLTIDDNTVWARASSAEFPEFKWARRHFEQLNYS